MPHTAYVLIENTLVQHKMAKNSSMALCYQNRASKGVNQCYGLNSRASISVHSVSVDHVERTDQETTPNPKPSEKLRVVDGGPFFPHDPGILAIFRLATCT